jgi:hypothetical protein
MASSEFLDYFLSASSGYIGSHGTHPTKPTSSISHSPLLENKGLFSQALSSLDGGSEVEAYLGCQRSRCHVVRATKCRQEVIERVLVRDVNSRQLQAHLVLVTAEDVVVSDGNVEKAPRHLLTLAVDAHRDPICAVRLHGTVRSIKDCEGLSQSFRSCGSTMLCLI